MLRCIKLLVAVVIISLSTFPAGAEETSPLKIGMIGLDTSHSIAFTKVLNAEDAAEDVADCKVTIAYPYGSRDIESSYSRIPNYTEQMKEMGVKIAESIDEVLVEVDAVLLETNDGKPHLEQAMAVIDAGKTLFIDKPVSASLTDAIAIYRYAQQKGVAVFTSSSLRYSKGAVEIRNGSIGKVHGAETFSPAHLEPSHPDLFWYGIHGVEALFTVMGSGCEKVVRVSTEDTDFVTGTWKGGRIGAFRGIRGYKGGYGGTAYGEKGMAEVGPYQGYRPLVVDIVAFFKTRKPPVAANESLEIYAFMEAADESKRRGGIPVSIAEVMEKASANVDKRIQELGSK
ncbi:MAG: Gfo/Idh/MocA family oxidoreductase [Planctomycetota bacterium]|nr:Gfo/Idh/MocA family oxidoreductase [Planctomycetota bacterium]